LMVDGGWCLAFVLSVVIMVERDDGGSSSSPWI
jgi:hypothetical protein